MKILFAGDYYPDGYIEWDERIGEIVKESDYSIVNFESPIVEVGEKAIPKYGPNLHSMPDALSALKEMGFNCVTLANNHTLDYGGSALLNTMRYATEYGIDYVGAGKNLSTAKIPLIKTINKRKIAIINCYEHEFSVATENAVGTNPLNPISQFYTIKEIRDKVDFVIVIVHGGHEGFQLPSPRMQDTYRFFIDCGADVVVNHHQHCYSGYEKYGDGLIFYGLGNFIFPDDNPSVSKIWNEGFLL